MKFGYARVSTKDQNLDRQIDALEKEGCEKIYSDKYTGSTLDRPAMNEMRKVLRRGDMIVVVGYDRLSRSLMDQIQFLDFCMKSGIDLKSLLPNEAWFDTTTPEGQIAFKKNALDIEAERTRALERSRHGMAVARERGRVGGRKHKLTPTKIIALKQLYEGKQHTIAQLCDMFEVSVGTLYKAINGGYEQ
jgi:DNA invertase Pin-like site-specific DNA recombinase